MRVIKPAKGKNSGRVIGTVTRTDKDGVRQVSELVIDEDRLDAMRKLAKAMKEVEGFENRGTDEVPFGFVYFKGEIRVGYSEGTVWPGNWGSPSPEHFVAAWRHLKGQGITGYEAWEPVYA